MMMVYVPTTRMKNSSTWKHQEAAVCQKIVSDVNMYYCTHDAPTDAPSHQLGVACRRLPLATRPGWPHIFGYIAKCLIVHCLPALNA
jgi:hypothetical protein